MNDVKWQAVEDFISGHLIEEDAALSQAQKASAAAGLPDIAVSATQGKLLQLLAQTLGARKILEIGTLGGYSSIWLARGLVPDGRLITLEVDPAHADVARRNLDRAGLGGRVEVRLGPALETLPGLVEAGPFDLIFIDADKQNNADYLKWAVRLARPGSLIIVDNVVRDGKVADADSSEPMVLGTRRLFAALAADQSVEATALQTVGPKGYDGFVVARVKAP
jgi:predicted O-methyltransferase YrrM